MSEQRIDDPNTNRGLQAAIIAEQNDAFRKTVGPFPQLETAPEGKLVMTQGVYAQSAEFHKHLLEAVALFDSFSFDNDPTGWHEFGEVVVEGKRVWFKIDLYDRRYEMGAEAPHDPDETRRVLTLLFQEEY